MSLFNVPGFIKLFFGKQNVQTKYNSVHQIPVMSIQKQISYISKPKQQNQNVIFIHTRNVGQNKELIEKFVQLKNKNYDVYLIPEQSPFENFQTIKNNTPKGITTLGKMNLNGDTQHPLIKFLKSNCDKLYDFRMIGADPISQQTGAFVKNYKNRVKYLKKRQFQAFLNKQLQTKNIINQNKAMAK